MTGRTKSALLVAAVLVAGGAGFWFGRDARPAPPEPHEAEAHAAEADAPASLVRTRPLTSGTVARSAEAYGTIQFAPGSSMSLSVPYEAMVLSVLAAPGSAVGPESTVVEVGPTAEAQLQIKQARDALLAADRNLEQVRRRLAEQLATNADLAAAEQAQQAARTQDESLGRRGVEARRSLAAGIAGVLSQVNVQPGQVVPAGTALAVVSPLHGAEAVVGVEPADAALLTVGAAVPLRDVNSPEGFPPAAGTLRRVGQQVNPQTRLREVSVALPAGSTLLPGTFVVAELPTGSARGWVVPRSAVRPGDEGERVLFVVVDGRAKRRVVKVGLGDREQLEITGDDLREGDAVVISGAAELEEGMAVHVEPEADGPATAATTSPAVAPSTAPADAADVKAASTAPAAEDK